MGISYLSDSFTKKCFKFLAPIIVIFCFAVAINSLIQAINWIDKPFPGFLLYDPLVVSEVTVPHWAQNQGFGLESYDKIIEINSKKVSRADEVYSIIIDKPIGTPINYLILRDDNFVKLTIPTMKFTLSDFLQVFGIEFAVGLVFLFIGALVYFLKPELISSKVFLVLCSTGGIWLTQDFNYQTTYSPLYSVDISYLGQIFVPALLIYLSLVFPTENKFFKKNHYIVILPLSFSSLLFILQLVFFDSHVIWGKIYQATYFYILLGALAVLASVTVSYLKPSSKLDRQRAQVMLLGAILGYFLPAVAAVIVILFRISNINYVAFPVLLFPISVAYAIVKHNLFDIDEIVRKGLAYTVLTGIAGGVFGIAIIGSNLILADYGGWRNPVTFILPASFVVLALNPLRSRIQDIIDTAFFRKRYDSSKTISELSAAMVSILSIDEIANKIISTITETMFLSSGSLFLLDRDTGEYRVYVTTIDELKNKDFTFKFDNQLIFFLNSYKKEIFKEDLIADQKYIMFRGELMKTFQELKASVLIPLHFKDQLVGILSLGEKKSGQMYTSNDMRLLRTLANQSAIAIENALAYELVENYAKKLEEANKELGQTQAQLVQAEKMSAIGQLAAGIAHEIRNPLNIIEGARYYLSQIVDGENSTAGEYLDYIKHEIDRTNHLIDNLLRFSRLEPPHFEILDLNDILEHSLVLLRKQIFDNDIKLITNFNDQVPNIIGDQNQLWQVFINILINAIQAMPRGGELRVDTGLYDPSSEHVFISFADTGAGIDEIDLSKIFNPFFTTKSAGTGLGLSISYKIVEEHQGSIMVSSEKGIGSTFVVELPIRHNNGRGKDDGEQKSISR
jgi:signal transduction histidine kinase